MTPTMTFTCLVSSVFSTANKYFSNNLIFFHKESFFLVQSYIQIIPYKVHGMHKTHYPTTCITLSTLHSAYISFIDYKDVSNRLTELI